MKPNAFIDPKAFGHFVIMLPNIPNRPRTFCAKRFSVLLQTIFQSAENGFRTCRHPFYGSYHPPLSHLTQIFFCSEGFASFRHPLYQRLKVNFLTLHPSQGFHRKMRKQHTGSDLQM